jgi:hypothetical protein
MSECFWTGFINCAEPSCGGDTPEPPPTGVQWIAGPAFNGETPSTFEAVTLFSGGYETPFPGLAELFACGDPGWDPGNPVDLFELGYLEVRVGGVWYGIAEVDVPIPASWSLASPCPEPNPCNGNFYYSISSSVTYRGPSLPDITVPAYFTSNGCF